MVKGLQSPLGVVMRHPAASLLQALTYQFFSLRGSSLVYTVSVLFHTRTVLDWPLSSATTLSSFIFQIRDAGFVIDLISLNA